MNTTFMISGGAGRVICAIPALVTYHTLHPDDDFKVLIHGWSNLFDHHPILHHRTYDANMKGAFELIIKHSILITPEPYYDYDYYNQKISLIQAFNKEINGYSGSNEMTSLYLGSEESKTAQVMIQQAKDRFKKDKFVVFQPFGSGAKLDGNEVVDPTNRSLTTKAYETVVQELSKEAVVLYFGDNNFNTIKDNRILSSDGVPNADLRFFMAMISHCDYFVGVDSVGQHVARSFDKPGTVLMGSTFERNVTYPDWFKIYRKKDSKPYYSPIRISSVGSDLADKINDGIMDFTKHELDEILTMIRNDMNGYQRTIQTSN